MAILMSVVFCQIGCHSGGANFLIATKPTTYGNFCIGVYHRRLLFDIFPAKLRLSVAILYYLCNRYACLKACTKKCPFRGSSPIFYKDTKRWAENKIMKLVSIIFYPEPYSILSKDTNFRRNGADEQEESRISLFIWLK